MAAFFQSIHSLYKGLRKTEICKDGINTSERLVPWEMIEEAKWNVNNSEKVYIRYDNLTLTLKEDPKSWFATDMKQTVALKIKPEDKPLVDKLLDENLHSNNETRDLEAL